MRIMGIDYGDARIGIAVSDPFGWTAQGLDTIYWKDDPNIPIDKICKLVKEYGIKKIIVGYPVNMDGSVGERALKTEEFINRLSERVGDVRIIKWDERLTTVAAHRILSEAGVKASKRKKSIDRIAAVYILQGYLDSLRNETIDTDTDG
ncbi:MAG TPA: Holliday junction resolvase RuvX [Clostridiaceae bacterium]|nr:Holliday junction resolvase RuvX [Clostridiaceae bacterium]